MEVLQEKSFRSTTMSCKLYLDDIETIISKLNLRNLDVEITDSENKYDSLSDLMKHKGKNPKNISLQGSTKDKFSTAFVNIRLTDISSSIYISGSVELISLGYEIESFLKERKISSLYIFISSRNAIINILLNLVIIAIVAIYKYYTKSEVSYKFAIYLTIFWIIILVLSELNPSFNPKIELERKHKLNFYQRNKDKLLIGILMAIIGFLFALFIQYVMK